MIRDVAKLSSHTFDVLVVGGGIYGLTIAYDAAQRGLSVALIDRADFGSGASFNHLRTIHGGLRHLRSLDVMRARESMLERRTFARIAPHLVRPLPFALPVTPSLARGPTLMRAGFMVDRILGFDRNRGVRPSLHLPPGRIVSGDALRRLAGPWRGIARAAIWNDYITTEADRLTFSFAAAASQEGAVLANYTEAVALATEGQRVMGVRARDCLGGGDLDIGARITVNATGGAVDRLLEPLGAATGIPMLLAMNLVTRREAGEAAFGGQSSSGRNLFLVPWQGRALFGTWESDGPRRSDEDIVEGDVVGFIDELNRSFPGLALTLDDVSLIHRGIVPAVVVNGRYTLQGREHVRDHAREATLPLEGLVSVVGAKYTTARGVAERVTDRLMSKLNRRSVACRTATALLPGAIDDLDGALAQARRQFEGAVPGEVIQHLVAGYGQRHRDIFDISAGRPDWRALLAENSRVIGAQLVWAARQEMAVTLADAVIRRTPLGALGYPGDAAAARAAELMGAELGWTPQRKQSEVEALRRFYTTTVAPVRP